MTRKMLITTPHLPSRIPHLTLGHSRRRCLQPHLRRCELHGYSPALFGMTLNDLNGLLNEALAPVSEALACRLTVAELHPPIRLRMPTGP